MSIEVWGLMPKSQIDNETVEEAILRLIAIHESDPTAHMGENEAIEAHRKSEIIDHLASSIYDDKFAYDRNMIDIDWTNLTIFSKSTGVETNGIKTVLFPSPNSTSARWLYGSIGDMTVGEEFDFIRNPRITTSIMLSGNTSQTGYIIVGETDEGRGFGWKIVDNKLYGLYFKQDWTEQLVEILTISTYTIYKLEARVKYPNVIEFYVNNALVTSFTSAVLNFSMEFILSVPYIYFKSTTSTSRNLFVRGFHWEADFPA
jgi:hypothetical protein